LQFLREKYILFRTPNSDPNSNLNSNLEMNTSTSYENPLNLPKLEENYRGFDWNTFWMHHLLILIKAIIRTVITLAKKHKQVSTRTVSSSSSSLQQSSTSTMSLEKQLTETVEEMGRSIEDLISGGVGFSQQMKEWIEKGEKEEVEKEKNIKKKEELERIRSWVKDCLCGYVRQGCNNWNIKLFTNQEMTSLFVGCAIPANDEYQEKQEIPMDLIKLIFTFVTL